MSASAATTPPGQECDRARSRSPRRLASSASSEVVLTESAASGYVSYSGVDFRKWVCKQVGKSSQGSPTICIYNEATKRAPIFCLYEKNSDECGTIIFPLEPHKDAQRPAFMTGSDPWKKVESLELVTSLEEAQVEFVKRVDAWCKTQALEHSKEWFGRACTAAEIDLMYCSPVKIDDSGRYGPNLRTKMNLSGIDRFLTRVVFVRSNGTPEEGSGWDFVEPRLGEKKWRQHRARMVLEARRIWVVNKRFGLNYSITDLAVKERAETRPSPFASDSTVEALASLPMC